MTTTPAAGFKCHAELRKRKYQRFCYQIEARRRKSDGNCDLQSANFWRMHPLRLSQNSVLRGKNTQCK